MGEYYDAVDRQKAHEYYLRTRKLKGRKKGAVKPALSSIRPGSHARGLGKKAAKASKSPEQLRSEMKAKVAGIKARVAKLEAALKELLAETESKKSKASEKSGEKGSSSSSKSEPLTAAEKAKKAKDNKEYYDENKKPAEKKSSDEMSNEEKIAEIRKQLTAARAQLRAALARSDGTSTKPANGMKGR